MTRSHRLDAIQIVSQSDFRQMEPIDHERVEDYFGEHVFDDRVMKSRLSDEIYNNLKQTIDNDKPLDLSIADAVAVAMRDWAVEKGATHYTHWFQPMTGWTAEKHDSFIEPKADGNIVLNFSGSSLVQGEPDASSFPSGGIRATFEARGYTAWDPTCPVFLREGHNGRTLCIPTSFYSYTGEALDEKTPLLRAMDALSKAAVKVLHLLENPNVTRVTSTVGAEQEYFLIDKSFYHLRPDLMSSGRTLYGAQPARGQQMEDHYFGSIKPRILAFMNDAEKELYRVGIPVKTRHNEVSPAQYEVACVFQAANIATDQNMLLMAILGEIADKHGLVCLMHEKPFAGVNGSGKHNNWSLADNLGQNLLDPGETPLDNAKFLIFLSAVIRAVDEHNDLLRSSVANPGNDHRLGANEAPPAIISIFLGDQLTSVVEELTAGKKMAQAGSSSTLSIGVTTLPPLPRHNTDRNRTSPFAFTGNKFEYRAVGSSQNISLPNMVLNTIVADALESMASEIKEQLDRGTSLTETIHDVVCDTLKKHKRVIFNGDNYTEDWATEAEKRGLSNLKSTVEALAVFDREETKELFDRYNVLTPRESESRVHVKHDQYIKQIEIEGKMTVSLGHTRILPAALSYQKKLADTINSAQAASAGINQKGAIRTLQATVEKINALEEALANLESELDKASSLEEEAAKAEAFGKRVIPAMNASREIADSLELLIDDEFWPFPKYNEMLFIH